ncbi:FCD domain-containing protein [Cohnella sp. CFH 77786]|uniref:GntR family transcriptional regulator n=1 Tax=Cohnella sp. CFH 77786 TaxID=2662265 RepID=UPI001C608E82|nr:GntR family transcriptional regulator [Cohnella sp. CFH 77786]MBW5447735.1 FCD domain-containing protein [Cohnella sp. CFH 77786]
MDSNFGSWPPASTRDAVYVSLRERILSLELAPGASLSEKEMSLRYNVSRTPVRESFLRLAEEGLLFILPQRGTYVSLIDTELVEESRFMREQLESAVIRLACAKFPEEGLAELERNLRDQLDCIGKQDDKRMFELDEAFHRTIFEGCRKRNTWALIQKMNAQLNRARMLRLVADHRWEHLYAQHRRMADAIIRRDPDGGERVMREHLSLPIADLAVLKEQYPHYFK